MTGMTEPTTDPFRTWTPVQIEGLPEAPDVVRQWEQLHAGSPYLDARHVMDTGSKLAGEVRRLRAWVITLERENADLRGLVERATHLLEVVGTDDETLNETFDLERWRITADRILAPVTGEAE